MPDLHASGAPAEGLSPFLSWHGAQAVIHPAADSKDGNLPPYAPAHPHTHTLKGTESFSWNTETLRRTPSRKHSYAMEISRKHLPGSRVILCPYADKLIEVMRAQDGGIPGQIFKVVHDDSNK